MTIEQAKGILLDIKSENLCIDDIRIKERYYALNMAIKSLEMWDKFSDEIPHLFDKRYVEIEDKYSDDLAEGFFQSEKIVKRRIREIKKEIEE